MIPIFVVDGTDYSLVVIALAGGVVLFGVQLLCCRAKRQLIRFLPLVPVGIPFVLAIVCLFEDTGGFVDIRAAISAVLAGIGGMYGLFIGAAWLVWYFKAKKLRF